MGSQPATATAMAIFQDTGYDNKQGKAEICLRQKRTYHQPVNAGDYINKTGLTCGIKNKNISSNSTITLVKEKGRQESKIGKSRVKSEIGNEEYNMGKIYKKMPLPPAPHDVRRIRCGEPKHSRRGTCVFCDECRDGRRTKAWH